MNDGSSCEQKLVVKITTFSQEQRRINIEKKLWDAKSIEQDDLLLMMEQESVTS